MEAWGQGWDYLVKPIWEKLDNIRNDNLHGKYDLEQINHCFDFMYRVLLKDCVENIKSSDWDVNDKYLVMDKTQNVIRLFREAKNEKEKVIAINCGEQLLRSIY
jgi:hypothetical protein